RYRRPLLLRLEHTHRPTLEDYVHRATRLGSSRSLNMRIGIIRDAFAVRERLGDPRVVPGFRCSFRPDMPPSLTPGSSIVVSVQNIDVDIGLRHGPKGSALPMIPQSVSRGARISGLLWFADCYGLSGCWPPCTDLTGLPANGGFYFQAFNGSVVLPA